MLHRAPSSQNKPTAVANEYTPPDVILPDFVLDEAKAASRAAAAKEDAIDNAAIFDPLKSDAADAGVAMDASGALVTQQQRLEEHPHSMWVQGSAYLRTGQYLAAIRCFSKALMAEKRSTWKPHPKDYRRRGMKGVERRKYDMEDREKFNEGRARRMRIAVLRMADCYQGLADFSKAMLLYHTCVAVATTVRRTSHGLVASPFPVAGIGLPASRLTTV